MKFDQAMARCLPGQYVKQSSAGWNEYSIQYGRDATGKPFWSAGGTCGGTLTEDRWPNDTTDDWEIYERTPSYSYTYRKIA